MGEKNEKKKKEKKSSKDKKESKKESKTKKGKKKQSDVASEEKEFDLNLASPLDVGPSLSSYISATGGPASWEKPAVVETDCDDDEDEGETILGSIFKVVESFYDECNTK